MSITQKFRGKLICNSIKDYITTNSTVLDIGCGNGEVTNVIADYFNIERDYNLKITGTDVINYTKHGFEFHLAEFNKLPFNDNEFDIGLINDVIHHISKDLQIDFIKEALRVCKKVIIFDLDGTTLAKMTCFLVNRFYEKDMASPLSHRKINEWIFLLRKHNIKYKTHPIKIPFYYPYNYFTICVYQKELKQ